MHTRRQFLHDSALIALSPMVPAFLDSMARAAGPASDSRILVVVQMEGGNDGINTVVPFGDDGYFQNRIQLRIPSERLLKLNDHVGLHPSMRGIAALMEKGRLAIVQGVGYPNPSRSHFRSMEIWQTALLTKNQNERGWIGRAFDTLPPRPSGPDAIYVGINDLPQALIGRRTEAASITSAEDLALAMAAPADHAPAPKGDNIRQFVEKKVLSAYCTARELAGSRLHGAASDGYPQSALANQLRLISRFIKSGAATRVYVASHFGYDTHQLQLSQHEDLLAELSSSITAFLDDLRASGLSDRVLLVAFSEFGRRVEENGSLGTDHGTAAPLILAGDAVKPGLIGTTPSLSDLIDGDLKMSIDFRQVYATLLKRWLNIPPKQVLEGDFQLIDVLKAT